MNQEGKASVEWCNPQWKGQLENQKMKSYCWLLYISTMVVGEMFSTPDLQILRSIPCVYVDSTSSGSEINIETVSSWMVVR